MTFLTSRLDAACTTEDCKCPSGYCFDTGVDALKMSWGGACSAIRRLAKRAAFIKKAYDEVINGDCPVVVMVLPSNCQDSKAFQQYVKKNFFYETLSGRVAFIDPETKQPMKGNNSGTTIVYFKKDIMR